MTWVFVKKNKRVYFDKIDELVKYWAPKGIE